MTTTSRTSSWAFVVSGLGACGAFLGALALVPADQPELRTALVGVLVAAGYASISRWIGSRVEDVHEKVTAANRQLAEVGDKVNGRMSELIEALRDAEQRAARAEYRADRMVSRETRTKRRKREGRNRP